MKDIKKVFQSPPKGGNEKGVPTHNPMSSNPLPGRSQSPFGPFSGGGGTPLKDQRKAREAARMSPEEASKAMMEEWKKEPPPTTGPAAQTILRDSFEAGENSARNQQQHSGRSGQPEMRNYARGGIPEGKTAAGMYQFEERGSDGLGGQIQKGEPAGPPYNDPTPKPVLNPDTSATYRSDGKPVSTMK